MNSFRELRVWQIGMDLTVATYELTKDFPRHEQYGLISQMRRAAASVPANISEGHGRSTTKEYLRFLAIAMGSLAELVTFFYLAERLHFGNPEQITRLLAMADEEGRMLRGLQKSLKAKLSPKS